MALQRKGDYSYGDAQADIRDELARYSVANGYPAAHFVDAVCGCGGKTFRLLVDDGAGAAVRVCARCHAEHALGDSAEFLEDAKLEAAECPCGGNEFEITAGVALYEASEDVKWLYIGGRCARCDLTACYGDWKNECSGFREFLSRI